MNLREPACHEAAGTDRPDAGSVASRLPAAGSVTHKGCGRPGLRVPGASAAPGAARREPGKTAPARVLPTDSVSGKGPAACCLGLQCLFCSPACRTELSARSAHRETRGHLHTVSVLLFRLKMKDRARQGAGPGHARSASGGARRRVRAACVPVDTRSLAAAAAWRWPWDQKAVPLSAACTGVAGASRGGGRLLWNVQTPLPCGGTGGWPAGEAGSERPPR